MHGRQVFDFDEQIRACVRPAFAASFVQDFTRDLQRLGVVAFAHQEAGHAEQAPIERLGA